MGPAFDPDADEAESDLDTQYMAMMGPGVPVSEACLARGSTVFCLVRQLFLTCGIPPLRNYPILLSPLFSINTFRTIPTVGQG